MVPRAYGQLTAELAARFGLEPRPWGLVLCQDAAGGLVTLATEDLAWWDTLVGLDAAELAAVELLAERFTLRRAGWPRCGTRVEGVEGEVPERGWRGGRPRSLITGWVHRRRPLASPRVARPVGRRRLV
jgi:hypothetical protein